MDGPLVALHLQSEPQTLTLVRGMLSGVAELLEMDPELLDDLKTSVSEACNNVVRHAYDDESGPMEVRLFLDGADIRVTVEDEGVGLRRSSADLDAAHGIGVSVIQALTREARFTTRPAGGTEVSMAFDGHRGDLRLFTAPPLADAGPSDIGRHDGSPLRDGEIVVLLSPVALFAGVLGRLARALAATAHFSLDRFSDVYLITDALAAHAARAAAGEWIAARVRGGERRLTVTAGPFRRGSCAGLPVRDAERVSSPLALLADEVLVRDCGAGEAVVVVVVDHRR